MQVDCHVHSNYSDGRLLSQMVEAGAAAGLDGIGIADHCNVIEDGKFAQFRNLVGHNLDRTYDRRREAIVRLRQESDIRIYDAVEMDFHPTAVAEIDKFLQDAAFEYSIGSVHFLDGENIHIESYFRQQTHEQRLALVEEYFDQLVALIESELFDIAAHLDLIERIEPLRNLAGPEQYRRVATAFAGSKTIPELNAGRLLPGDGGFVHPSPEFTRILVDDGIPFTLGTDSHFPGKLQPRLERLTDHEIYDSVEFVGPETGFT